MQNFTIFTELFAKLGHTVLPICDNRLITVDHQIPIGYNTFLQASRASSHDITAIKKAIKLFSLACKWSFARAFVCTLVVTITYIAINTYPYIFKLCTNVSAENSSFPCHPVGPIIHISTCKLEMSFKVLLENY